MMMNKMKTARIQLIRFLFVLPLLLVLMVAFRSDLKQRLQQKNTVYIAGILVDGETGKRVANMPLHLEVSDDSKRVKKTIKSDRDGFYYYELDTKQFLDSVVYFGISGQGEYEKFDMGATLKKDVPEDGEFMVSFLTKDDESGTLAFKKHTMFPYYVSKKSFFDSEKLTDIKHDIKTYLAGKESEFSAEYNLKVDFEEVYPRPTHVITKFKNAFFDQNRKLLGYEGVLKLYLNDVEVDYEGINEAFKDMPPASTFGFNQDSKTFEQTQNSLRYYTYALVKHAPPSELVLNNYEVLDIEGFEMKRLENQPYFVDGFRSASKIGFGPEPSKEEIKKIILLKGDLAQYYDHNLKELLWIETWPANKVRERPAFKE